MQFLRENCVDISNRKKNELKFTLCCNTPALPPVEETSSTKLQTLVISNR